MTYNEYWYGDPLMVRAFRRADKLRRKRMDEDAWTQGLYFLTAINATVGNIGKKPGQELNKYPERPFTFAEKKEAQKQIDEEQEVLLAKAWMTSFVQFGKNWGKR